MLGSRTSLFYLVALCMLVRSAGTCDTELVKTVLKQAKIIPILDPDDLEERCQQLNESLHCALNQPVTAEDLPQLRVFNIRYTTILKVIEYPCHTARQEYMSGSVCWKSPQLVHMLTDCYSNNNQVIISTFCTGQKYFINCTAKAILNIFGCGVLEQYLLRAMVTASHNSVCSPIPIPSWEHLTIATTTPRTMTTVTATPSSALSSSALRPVGVTVMNKADPEAASRNSALVTDGPGYHVKTQASTGGGGRLISVATVCAVAASMSVFVTRLGSS